MDNASKPFSFHFLFATFFGIRPISADMISWTDENGVRHFSNAAGPERGTPSRSIEEYKPEPPEPEPREADGRPRITKSQRDEIMRRYRENKKREEKKWQKIY
jgi:hypothetical protein